MDVEDLIKKIQVLINNRSLGVEERETRDTYQIIHFRDSFRHKYNSILFHFYMIQKIKKEVKQMIERIHGNKDFLIEGSRVREKMDFQRQVQFECTVLLEDIIYHLTSLFDNLPKMISVYYKTVQSEWNFRTTKNQFNQRHTLDLEITKLINNNWDWIEKIKEFRAQIFHHHSKICEGIIKATFGKDKDGRQRFNEQIIVNVPNELKDAIGYKKDKIEIKEFNKILIDKSSEFFDHLFDILIKEHEKYILKKKSDEINNSAPVK